MMLISSGLESWIISSLLNGTAGKGCGIYDLLSRFNAWKETLKYTS